ncbi:hypothetical protein [Streptomyces sp. NPDC048611]|uniref:hypothetical protein n=1 Tax=Streptomyces sp. NPDC048611 TaxID=3155635 RepID=UPI00341F1759
MITMESFTDAARSTLLRLDISAPIRAALDAAPYNARQNTWLVNVDDDEVHTMSRMLRAEYARECAEQGDLVPILEASIEAIQAQRTKK